MYKVMNNWKLALLLMMLATSSCAQSKKIDRLIFLDENCYQILERVIEKNNKKTINSIYKNIEKYLYDTSKQESIIYVEYEHPVEPNTYKFKYKITKQIAALYIICVLYYRDTKLGNNFTLYDFRTNEELRSQEELDGVIKNIKEWLSVRNNPFPLSSATIFWDNSTMTSEDIYKRMRKKLKNE